MTRKVLIVEDDEAMAVALRDGFTYEGYEVAMANDGALGLQKASDDGADLMILDVMLPKMTGLDVCKRLRGAGNDIPIIMLTARGQEIDKILGLKFGADDYVTKPFSFMELMARAEAVLRRSVRSENGGGAAPAEEAFSFGDVEVHLSHHEASKAGEPIEMSPREFRLLEYFYRHRGEVVSRDQLLDSVWEYDNMPFTRTVDTHIAKLRKKIEDVPSDPKWIVTVHRLGYKFTG